MREKYEDLELINLFSFRLANTLFTLRYDSNDLLEFL